MNLGNPSTLQITGSQTIEFWIKPDDFNTRQNPYAKAYAGEGTITIETNGTVNYFYGTGGGNTNPYQTFTSGAALRSGRWQHVALVRDLNASPAKLRWYFDGKLNAETNASYPAASVSTLDATIATGYAGALRGSIDEFRIWNVARTATEISGNLDNPLVGNESGLVAYLPFDESAGATTAELVSATAAPVSGTPLREGSAAATLSAYASQGLHATYLLRGTIADTVAPSVVALQPIPASGHLFNGTSQAPANMTALRGNNGQSYYYTVTGTTGGSIWGTDVYTDDSSIAKAAVHAGVLLPGEIGAVKVTIKPGLTSYYGSSRFGADSSGLGTFAGSYGIERYTPALPFTLDGLYPQLWVSFSEEIISATLASPAQSPWSEPGQMMLSAPRATSKSA